MGEVMFTTQGLVIIGALMSALAATISLLFKQLMAAKDTAHSLALATIDKQHAELKIERDAYRGAAKQSVEALEIAIDQLRKERGQEPLGKVAPVVPEHRSPPTKEQASTAELATLRAKLVVAADELGLPPRTQLTDDDPVGTRDESLADASPIVDVASIVSGANASNLQAKASNLQAQVDDVKEDVAVVKEDVATLKEAVPEKNE